MAPSTQVESGSAWSRGRNSFKQLLCCSAGSDPSTLPSGVSLVGTQYCWKTETYSMMPFKRQEPLLWVKLMCEPLNVLISQTAVELPTELWKMVVDRMGYEDYLATKDGEMTLLSLMATSRFLYDCCHETVKERFPPIWEIGLDIEDGRLLSLSNISSDVSKTINSLLVRLYNTEEFNKIVYSNESQLSVPEDFSRITTIVVAPYTFGHFCGALDSIPFRGLVLKCNSLKKFVADGRDMKAASTTRRSYSLPQTIENSVLELLSHHVYLETVVMRVKEVSLHTEFGSECPAGTWSMIVPPNLTTVHVVFSCGLLGISDRPKGGILGYREEYPSHIKVSFLQIRYSKDQFASRND
ncbi:hypothetical protein BCR39DRAFT_545638 [Naematelia encephala]|uniref:Uncharacterized protein n=1 Tax=Naematelia encephala TaxID=71784 RepID=A0A1Y2AQN8_9TREE|nr:hypothetical protein BCR39DRAFT_545638 [Naematelia encephala]